MINDVKEPDDEHQLVLRDSFEKILCDFLITETLRKQRFDKIEELKKFILTERPGSSVDFLIYGIENKFFFFVFKFWFRF